MGMYQGIYLDHASTTYVAPEIITVIKKHLEENWANPSNLYKISDEPKRIIREARETIARLVGAQMNEIFFTSGASEGNAWVCAQRDYVLCSPYEHHNLTRNPKTTIIDEVYLENALLYKDLNPDWLNYSYQNYICSWMMVNNETGEIFDIKSMAQKAHELGMLFHSDMTQALGNVPINMKDLGVDFATFTGHKIHAPKGIGFIYINSKLWGNEGEFITDNEEQPVKRLIPGGNQELGFRAGTENVAYIDALRMAVHNAVINKTSKQNHCGLLKKLMVEELNKNGISFIINSPGNSVNNILNISIKDISGENLMMDLSDRNIYVGTGSACVSGGGEPSEVLQAMGVSEEYIHGALRFSFDFSNTREDIITTAKIIRNLVKGYQE